MRPIMPYYQPERPRIVRQYSGESERTDHLLKRHRHPPRPPDCDNSTDDDIFSGRHIQQTGTMGSKRSKSTPLTVEESLSGDFQQFGVRQPSLSYEDECSYDPNAIGAHRGGASRGGGSYLSFQQGEYSYSGSYQDGDRLSEEQYYQDQYLSQQEGQCYTDDGEPYHGEDQLEFEQRKQYHNGDIAYDKQRLPPPNDDTGYHQGHPDDYPLEYDNQYPRECDEYQYVHPEDYGDYQHGHSDNYAPQYREANSQDYSGYRQSYHDGYDRGQQWQQRRDWPQPEEEFSHFDDQEKSCVSGGQNKHYSSYEARQNAEGHWEEASEIDGGGTISSKTLNTNLEGMKYISAYDNNYYYGGEETAFDYSEGPELARSERPDIPFHGASTLASPLHDDEGSQGSGSVWEGTDLRNRSLVDNPVSPLSQTQFTIGNRTEYSDETRSTRRPVSRFIRRTKKSVGGCVGVTYSNGEFQVRTKRGKRGGSRSKINGGESATILDIMFNVGQDLILGTKGRRGRSRRRDPAAKIVDGFKEMFSCGVEDEVDDDDDGGSYRS